MQVITNCGHMVHEDVPDKVSLFAFHYYFVICSTYLFNLPYNSVRTPNISPSHFRFLIFGTGLFWTAISCEFCLFLIVRERETKLAKGQQGK